MNLLNLLTKEKRVAGIEISDSVIRIAFFRPREKKKLTVKNIAITDEKKEDDDLILIEEPIDSNIIADGAVIDVELLGKVLKAIWEKANLGTDYAIVAIPDDKIYSRVFSFPKSVDSARLTEAMRLAISFQIPMKTEEIYLDWERISGSTLSNEILFSTVPRKVVEGYVEALEKAGIKTVALESHLAAIARSVKLPSDETVLYSKESPDGATIFALRGGILRFSRALPFHFIPKDEVSKEIIKIRESLASETKGEIVIKEFKDATVRDEYTDRVEITHSVSGAKSKWLIALGTAMRAKIPEGEDNLISLLPVGTEEAYAYQRATTFVVLMRNLIVGVSAFFIIAYLAAYIFIFTLSKNTSEKITVLSTSSVPQGLPEMEEKISKINILTETGTAFLSDMPVWSNVLTEISLLTSDGITISRFSALSVTERFILTGTASSRDKLNNYKKILQGSSFISEVELPITNLELEGAIPFTVSFRLKDPSAIYYNNLYKQ